MDCITSSIFDPLSPQINEILYNFPNFDKIIPTLEQQNEFVNHIENPPLKKRSLASTFDYNDQKIDDIIQNDRKKKQKMIHREIERQRRHEMSSLFASLTSLLPFHYTKGKRGISAQLVEAVKYINHMQQKIQGLEDQREVLRKEVSNVRGYDNHNVIVNVFKESLEVIVSTSCGDDEGDQGLPLSKVLQCLIHEGLDVVNTISKKVNTKFVHSIHAQVADEDAVIDATSLKKRIADIQS